MISDPPFNPTFNQDPSPKHTNTSKPRPPSQSLKPSSLLVLEKKKSELTLSARKKTYLNSATKATTLKPKQPPSENVKKFLLVAGDQKVDIMAKRRKKSKK